MIQNTKHSLKLLQKHDRKWWEVMPIREDLSLFLSKDKQFWKRLGDKFGWHCDKNPYEISEKEFDKYKNEYSKMQYYFEESGIFEAPISRTKLGEWCWWVSIKNICKT